jgi:serine/threonine protein kinase
VSTEPRVGTILAGYRIESVLGRGGMSVVYLAEHLGLRRKAALKLLSPELADDERFRERFIRESRMAAALDHPNIVPIYEAGEAEGQLFIAMRYVRGTDLRTVLSRQGKLPPELAVSILSAVAGALDQAHAEGLVHRDVKPANILIASERGDEVSGHVYLSDFGITRRMASQSGLTMTGQFVGTIDYAAPEQIETGLVDGRTDQYALGCVLFECMTGRPPFMGDSPMTVLWAHVRQEPPTVSTLRPELPPALDAAVGRSLAKSPDDRFESCTALMRAAGAAIAGGRPTVPQPEARTLVTDSAGSDGPGTAVAQETPTRVAPSAREARPTEAVGRDVPTTPFRPTTPGPRGRRPALIAGAALVVVGVVAVAVVLATRSNKPSGEAGQLSNPGTPQSSSGGTQSSPGGSAATPPAGNVLFQDGFSDPTSGWPTYESSSATASYADGAFQIDAREAKPQWTTTRLMADRTALADVGVQAKIARQSGPDASSLVGVLCRYHDQNNTYLLGAKGDGSFLIAKRLDGAWATLKSGKAPEAVVRSGSENNVVRGDCVGTSPVTLTLWVNGSRVAQATDGDSRFTEGSVGLAVWPFTADGMLARFDDFRLVGL